MKHVHIV